MPKTQLEQLNLHSRPSNEFLATIPIKKRHFLFTRPTSPPQGLPNLNDHNVCDNKNELSELESSCANVGSKFKGPCPVENSGIYENNPETTIVSKPQDNTDGLSNHVADSEFSAIVHDHMHECKSAFSEMSFCNTADGYKSANPDMSERKHENLEPDCTLQINSDAGKPPSKGNSKESLNESRDLNIALEHDASFTVDEERFNANVGAMPKDGNFGVQDIVLKNSCSRIVRSSNTQIFELQGKLSAAEISTEREVHSDKVKEDSSHISQNRINWDLNTPMDAWEGTMESSLLSHGTVEKEHYDVGLNFDTFELGFKQILSGGTNGTGRKNPLSLHDTVNANSEACLELQLKPLSNSCTLRKLNVGNSEMSFLSLGTNPVPCASAPQSNAATVVKSEPVKKHLEGQILNLKTPDLNQVKIEPPEAPAVSKTAVFDNSNLASSKLTPKLEQLEDIRQANHISCKTSNKISNLTPQPCTARNSTTGSILDLPSNASGTVQNVQLAEQALVHDNSSDVIPESSIPNKEDMHSTSEACANYNLPSSEALQSLNSTLIGQHSSNSTLTDDLYKKMSEDSKVDESDEVDYKADLDELCDNTTCNSGSSQVNTGFEQLGNYDEDNTTAEVSCEANKLQSKTPNSVSSTDCPKESNSVDISKFETSVSSVGKTGKSVNRPANDNSNEGKGIDWNFRTNHSSSKAISSDDQIDQQNTKDFVSDKEVTHKDCNDRADQRVIYLNTASGKRNYTSERPLFSREIRRPTGESFRNRSFYDKSRKVENERHFEHQMHNSRFDALHGKTRAEQMKNTVYFSKQSRKQDFDDGRQNATRFPPQFQGRSPISHPRARDVSPKDRITGRMAYDFAGLTPEENEFERTRERTSFSPPLRRNRPLPLPPRRTITQWSPPTRRLADYNEHRSRSPQPVRIPYYQQERVGYRRMNVSPSREDNYPRSSRVSNKNIRNFSREISEEDNEEYFDQIREYDNDDKFIDDRRYNDDQKFINDRRSDARHGGPTREENQYHDEDVANSRDFDSRFRYRLGNSNGRLKGYADDHEDGYRTREEEQEWHDSRTRFNDTKTKRRRF